MSARLIAHLSERPASVGWLHEDRPCSVGRSPECDVCIDDPSISRRHAEFAFVDGAWTVRDLGSRNGTFVDGRQVENADLPLRVWLRFGHVHCEFAALGPLADSQTQQYLERLQMLAQGHGDRLGRQTVLPDLLHGTLVALIELAECESGFLLLREGDRWRIRASHGLDSEALAERILPGGAGAVQLALDGGQPVVSNTFNASPTLRATPSSAEGLRSLVALPMHEGKRLVALAYLERRRRRRAITDLEFELVLAFGKRAAQWIAARVAAAGPGELEAEAPDWRRVIASAGA